MESPFSTPLQPSGGACGCCWASSPPCYAPTCTPRRVSPRSTPPCTTGRRCGPTSCLVPSRSWLIASSSRHCDKRMWRAWWRARRGVGCRLRAWSSLPKPLASAPSLTCRRGCCCRLCVCTPRRARRRLHLLHAAAVVHLPEQRTVGRQLVAGMVVRRWLDHGAVQRVPPFGQYRYPRLPVPSPPQRWSHGYRTLGVVAVARAEARPPPLSAWLCAPSTKCCSPCTTCWRTTAAETPPKLDPPFRAWMASTPPCGASCTCGRTAGATYHPRCTRLPLTSAAHLTRCGRISWPTSQPACCRPPQTRTASTAMPSSNRRSRPLQPVAARALTTPPTGLAHRGVFACVGTASHAAPARQRLRRRRLLRAPPSCVAPCLWTPWSHKPSSAAPCWPCFSST